MKRLFAAAVIAMTVSFASCFGGDKDDNGKEDNRTRYNDGNTSIRPADGSTTAYTPADNTRTETGPDSSAFDAIPPK